MRILAALLYPLRLLVYAIVWVVLRIRHLSVRQGTWVEIDLEGPLRERSEEKRFAKLLGLILDREEQPEVVMPVLRRQLEAIRDFRKIAGVLVRVGRIDATMNEALELNERLHELRTHGKRVVVFLGDSIDNEQYVIAAAAEQVMAPPTSVVSPSGHASDALFLKETLGRLGIQFEVAAHGRFKSAPERFTRTDRSEADRDQTSALLDALDETMTSVLARGRATSLEKARQLLASTPMLAPKAVAAGLIDEVVRDEDVPARVGALLGDDKSAPRLAQPGIVRPLPSLPPILGRRRRAVAIVPVEGAIVDHGSTLLDAYEGMAVADRIVAALREALHDSRVGAVVLFVDSRGGSVTASDTIFSAVRRLDAEKPVIACFGSVAASGGYYVGCGARAIVASPLSITGSIGVFSMMPSWPKLAERLGLHRELLTKFPNALPHDPWRERTAEEVTRDQAQVDELYDGFVSLVAERRSMPKESAEAAAQGRVWIAKHAREHNLVDGLGGMEEAIARAKEAAKGRFARDPLWYLGGPRLPRPDPVTEAAKLLLPSRVLRDLLILQLLCPRKAVAWAPIDPSARRR
ncbi:MAG: signal peptide peptidase SppA [Deltaproteobacteria bacterium]|nr:signal peptide peptidase SppA [Deltaproteobacteria bacterium]